MLVINHAQTCLYSQTDILNPVTLHTILLQSGFFYYYFSLKNTISE